MNIECNCEVVKEIDEVHENCNGHGGATRFGIRRDANGVPQEVSNHILNTAVAATKIGRAQLIDV